jgi:hypothetical protein
LLLHIVNHFLEPLWVRKLFILHLFILSSIFHTLIFCLLSSFFQGFCWVVTFILVLSYINHIHILLAGKKSNRKNQQNKNCFFEKINKFDRHLARLIKEEKKRKKKDTRHMLPIWEIKEWTLLLILLTLSE